MPLNCCRGSGGLRAKKNNGDEAGRGEERKQHYDSEPFASDFKKDGDQDGHQRQYVSFSIDRRYRIICGVFRPAPAGRKTFAVPEKSACRPETGFHVECCRCRCPHPQLVVWFKSAASDGGSHKLGKSCRRISSYCL